MKNVFTPSQYHPITIHMYDTFFDFDNNYFKSHTKYVF